MLASLKTANTTPTELAHLLEGYKLCARTEGKSQNTIDIVSNSINYLHDFLRSNHLCTDARHIGPREIRSFILYLQQKSCFSNHPFSRPQERKLSSHTINCYLRSIRTFWTWLVVEEMIEVNPFDKVRLPRPSRKVIPALSENQMLQLLSAIDPRTPMGYRNYAVILTLMDTALRVSELASIKMNCLWLDEGLIKVIGKGRKERLVPIGRAVQRVIWRYVNRYRSQPQNQNFDFVFLTKDGRRMTKGRIEIIMKKYAEKAGITGIRCSPHTLRHTAAVRFLRNGGDVFSLQRMLGHSSLEMTRHYCELADVDVKRAHLTASPVDGLDLTGIGTGKATRRALLLRK